MEITTDMIVYHQTAHSFDEFRALVASAKTHLMDDTTKSPPVEFWYRGHDRGTYTLTPSLLRYRNSTEKEQLLFDLHTQTVVGHPGYRPISWEAVFAMQHYGIPTRLLDWTTKLWIATFFAVTANRVNPCIYILNPIRLNKKNRINRLVRVPEDDDFDFNKTFLRPGHPVLHPVAIFPTLLNDRMRSQCSRFTVHGAEPEPLEMQAPNSVARISLDEAACLEVMTFLCDTNVTPFALFPDHEGIAQFVRAEADLQLIPYDEGTATRIRLRLQEHAKHDRRILLNQGQPGNAREDLHIKGIGSCNLDSAYINRAHEASRMADWLREGPPFLFVTGKAGVGKTNFMLHCLLQSEAFQQVPFVFFSFKLYGSRPRSSTISPSGEHELVRHLYEIMIGPNPTDHERYVAQQMIMEGAVVVALDGLDELARVKSQEVVEAVARELEWIAGGSKRVRIVISCRDHIFERLKGTGTLGTTSRTKPLDLELFDEQTMRLALQRELGTNPGKLAGIAVTPLFYEMIRQAKEHWSTLLALSDSTQLQVEWFKVMLDANSQPAGTLGTLGMIAGRMLQNRSDLLEIHDLEDDSQSLIRRLAERPFALFTEELRDTYSFSHQSLREFVLAWCVAQEVKTESFELLTASSSFDYEGAEFYARVSGLLDVTHDVVGKLDQLLKRRLWNETQWNNLARNLFEMIGEMMPDDGAATEPVVQVALQHIDPQFKGCHYISYKTKYNIVRCLERIHYSAPRDPYFAHMLTYQWSETKLDRSHIAAHAVRGFHMKTQRPGTLPPTVFINRKPTPEMIRQDVEVSNALLNAIEALTTEEIPQDAEFFALNCSLALIRWLPSQPDLDRMARLLNHRHMSTRMKQNIIYALFRRYGLDIPERFQRAGSLQGLLEVPSSGDWSFACGVDTVGLLELMGGPPRIGGRQNWAGDEASAR